MKQHTIMSELVGFLFVLPFLMVTNAGAGELQHDIAHGGLLYDNWLKISQGTPPAKGTHPSYPKQAKKKGSATWRCKECHGWDYKGKDGAYRKGSHFTGIKGIREAVGKDVDVIVAVLKDDTHKLTDEMMSADDFNSLALFVSQGQVDMDKYINPETREVKGNLEKGAGYFNTICARCHGLDGRKIKDMKVTIGKVANANPWETLHKIRNGQPGEEMPALRALPVDIALDALVYARTLPTSK